MRPPNSNGYKGLTDKQKKFLANYLETGDRMKSAALAGYRTTTNNLSQTATAIMKHPDTKEYLRKLAYSRNDPNSEEVYHPLDVKVLMNLEWVLKHYQDIIKAGLREEKLQDCKVSDALNALVEVSKLMGFHQEKRINLNIDVDIQRAAEINEQIKQKERGY